MARLLHRTGAALSFFLVRLFVLTITLAAGGILAVIAAIAVPDQWLRAAPKGNLQRGDVFIAFGFGICNAKNGLDAPGESNLAIARWILKNNPNRKPTIVQEGVYLALEQLAKAQSAAPIEQWVVRLPHHSEAYVDTMGATLQSWCIMKQKQLDRPILVCHDLQLRRMGWCFEHIGLAEQAIIPELPAIPFDSASAQLWTRRKFLWKAKELFISWPQSIVGSALYWLGLGTIIGLAAPRFCWKSPNSSARAIPKRGSGTPSPTGSPTANSSKPKRRRSYDL